MPGKICIRIILCIYSALSKVNKNKGRSGLTDLYVWIRSYRYGDAIMATYIGHVATHIIQMAQLIRQMTIHIK